MRINKIPVLIFCLMGVLFLIMGKAYADASWQWFTQTRRYDVLSYDAAGAILIEALSINFIPRINRPVKVFGVVTAGNLISFLAPYALKALDSPNGLLQTYSQQLEENYYFIICAVYLFITLLVELLFVYGFLDKGRLRGLFALGGLYADLEDAFGVHVDLLTTDSLDEAFRKEIADEEVLIYG